MPRCACSDHCYKQFSAALSFYELLKVILARLACHLDSYGHWIPALLGRIEGGSGNGCLFYGGVSWLEVVVGTVCYAEKTTRKVKLSRRVTSGFSHA